MRRTAILFSSLFLCIGAFGSTPASALTYEGMPRPGGDCRAIAAEVGAGATWYGEFAGRHLDTFRDMYFPISARGCFESERACRRWLNEAISFAGMGGFIYARCTLGAPNY